MKNQTFPNISLFDGNFSRSKHSFILRIPSLIGQPLIFLSMKFKTVSRDRVLVCLKYR